MAGKQLNLANLTAIKAGHLGRVWDDAVERAIRDCTLRPDESRARKVILQAEFVPGSTDATTVDDLEVTFQVQQRFPAFSTKAIVMPIRKRGAQLMLAFTEAEEPES